MPLRRMSQVEPPAGVTAAAMPQHEEIEVEGDEDMVPIVTMTWSINAAGLKRLLEGLDNR